MAERKVLGVTQKVTKFPEINFQKGTKFQEIQISRCFLTSGNFVTFWKLISGTFITFWATSKTLRSDIICYKNPQLARPVLGPEINSQIFD